MDAIEYVRPDFACLESMRGRLTENCSWRIITSKASFAHTRAGKSTVSQIFTIFVETFSSDDCRNLICDVGSRILKGAGRGVDQGRGAYPLSMTRAATSSVERKTYQYLFRRVHIVPTAAELGYDSAYLPF